MSMWVPEFVSVRVCRAWIMTELNEEPYTRSDDENIMGYIVRVSTGIQYSNILEEKTVKNKTRSVGCGIDDRAYACAPFCIQGRRMKYR